LNTLDRNGVALPDSLDGAIDFVWCVRIAATNGAFISTTGWTYYEIPAEAVVQRSRSTALDEGTWQLTLGILADALPPLVEPLAYYQLEVDLIDDAGNAFPYHTGPIDSVSESWSLDGGALVRVFEVQSFGVLQRTKGFDVNAIAVSPFRLSHTGSMTGIAQAHFVTMDGPFTVGTPIPIPGTNAGGTVDITVGTGSFPGIVIDNDPAFGTPLAYGFDYTITNKAGTAAPAANDAAYLNPLVAIPAGTWYVRFFAVAYWGVLQNATAGRPFFIRTPVGSVTYVFGETRLKRTIADDFATLASAGCTTTSITVKDPEPFKSGTGVVAIASGPTEYLEWTSVTTGSPEVRQISSVSASGVITVSAFSAAPAEGDLIRLVTTQCFRAWERHNRGSGDTSTNPGFFTSSAKVTEYPKGLFELLPQSGIMRARSTRHWLTASTEVYVESIFYLFDTISSVGNDNRLESFYHRLLVTTLQLYAASDFETGNALLTFFKNFARTQIGIDQVLDEVGKDGLPPNGYIHDRPSGKLLVSAFRQKASPDLVLNNVLGVQIGSLPEPVSQVTVRSVGEPRIVTTELEPTLGGTWTDGQRLFDGVETSLAATATSGATVTFRVRHLDATIFPLVNKIEVFGERGVFEVYGERYDSTGTIARSRQLEGSGYFTLSGTAPTVIEEQQLLDMFASLGGINTAESRIVLKFYDDTMGASTLTAQVYEIRAYSNIETGWAAYISDDTTAGTGSAPAGWSTVNTEGFGPFWWVRDVGRARSFRFASSDYLKRVLPLYSAAYASAGYRRELVDLTRINQVECRRIAESYLDEYIRQGRTYTVTAMLDPRIDLGDTVSVTLGDGSSRDLFVWAIADSGGREDFEATYTLLDYAA